VWWPYKNIFLAVLQYNLTLGFQIWTLDADGKNPVLMNIGTSIQTNLAGRCIDINVNGNYARMEYSDNGVNPDNRSLRYDSSLSRWIASDEWRISGTSVNSLIPYYGNSWLMLSLGTVTSNGTNTFSPSGLVGTNRYPKGKNGCVASDVRNAVLDEFEFPDFFIPTPQTVYSYQIEDPDAGFIAGAAFNGKTWVVVLPATYNGTTVSSRVTICASPDLNTACKGNSVVYIDEEHIDTVERPTIYPQSPRITSDILMPRVVWTGNMFIVFGTGKLGKVGLLMSPDGIMWSSATNQPALPIEIRDVCFTPNTVTLTEDASEFNHYFVSTSTIFNGSLNLGGTASVKNIGLGYAEVSIVNNGAISGSVILPAQSTRYGGRSTDATIYNRQGFMFIS
jgi:hypothetical protein